MRETNTHPASVADVRANHNETIVFAANVIGNSIKRKKIFEEIYRGRKQYKSVDDISEAIGFTKVSVLQGGGTLARNHVVIQDKIDGKTIYRKDRFISENKKKILSLVEKPSNKKKFPTKQEPAGSSRSIDNTKSKNISVNIQVRRVNANHITVDDIESFKKVENVNYDDGYIEIPEEDFKNGVAQIIGERGEFKDWGGESCDLISTHLKLNGRRVRTAFAFKGPGKKGKLTPGKMGANGDQIQRLALCPADLFLVQYWGQIESSVMEQLQKFVQLKSYFENRDLWYGVVDGNDSARLMAAYPKYFPSVDFEYE